jgi:hypothetical protein
MSIARPLRVNSEHIEDDSIYNATLISLLLYLASLIDSRNVILRSAAKYKQKPIYFLFF